MIKGLLKWLSPLVIASMILAACSSPSSAPVVPNVPVAPTTDPNAVQVAPQTSAPINTPEAQPNPVPENPIIVLDYPLDPNDPFWAIIEQQMAPYVEYSGKGDKDVMQAGMGDTLLLPLLAALTNAGCTTGRWVGNHLVADQAWRIARIGGVPALYALIQNLKNAPQQVQLVGVAIEEKYNKVGFWFRSAGQDIMLIFNRQGWSTMMPLGTTEDINYGQPIFDGIRLFRDIVQYNPANGEINGYLMLNNNADIVRSVGGELTIGFFALTTSVAATLVFLQTFGGCLEQRLMDYRPFKEYVDSLGGQSPNAPIVIKLTDQEAQELSRDAAVTLGLIFAIKLVFSAVTQQWEVMLIPPY